ncbi:MAG: hypothetical protein ACRC3H_06605 [Lachnospiraceae bacterium]
MLNDSLYSSAYYKTSSGTSFEKDFLNTTLGTQTSENNKKTWFQKLAADDAAWYNYPGEVAGVQWMGVREVIVNDAAGLTSDFVAYSSLDTNAPRYKKVGNIVCVKSVVSPSSATNVIGSTTEVTICTLPSGYRPPDNSLTILCHGSGLSIWKLQCSTGGVISASRYQTGGAYSTPGTTAWMPFYLGDF